MSKERELLKKSLDAMDSVYKWMNQLPIPTEGCTYKMRTLFDVMEGVEKELAKPNQEPIAWLYDWIARVDENEDGVIKDWVSFDYDEAHNQTMGCHNIRPLYMSPQQNTKSDPVAWFEKASSGEWFLAYGFNPDAETKPLYLSPQQQKPLSYEEICNVYLSATGQTVRAQDVNLILAFASALEKHHNNNN